MKQPKTPKPWLDHYPAEVPLRIETSSFLNLQDLFHDCVAKYASLPCLTNMGQTLTYQQLDELSDQFAAFLQHQTALKAGDRVALQMPNLLQYAVCLMGIIKAGMIPVNTNPLYTASEMQHQFTDSGARAVIILENYVAKLDDIINETPIELVVVTRVGDLLGIKGVFVNMAVKYLKKLVPAYKLRDKISLKQVLRFGSRLNMTDYPSEHTDIALLQYTGGTTGVAKGAALSHSNLIANILQANAWMQPLLKEREEIVITPLPMYHVFSFTVNFFSMLTIGAHNVLITDPRDLQGFVKTLNQQSFTVLTGVNTLFNGLLNYKPFHQVDFSHLKVTVGGAMAIQPAVAARWKEVTGNTLVEGYGLSETSPLLTCNPISTCNKPGTIGMPVPETDVIIADQDGKSVPLGEEGEILTKGPQVMKGYWQKPEENQKVFINGWFKTGDIGLMDNEGYITIVDRLKNMINISGFKVFPNEVEKVLTMHPKVLEAAVIGVSSGSGEEKVKAFVVKKDSSLTKEELREYSKQYLTYYKRPSLYEFRDELPKTNVGKVLHRALK